MFRLLVIMVNLVVIIYRFYVARVVYSGNLYTRYTLTCAEVVSLILVNAGFLFWLS